MLHIEFNMKLDNSMKKLKNPNHPNNRPTNQEIKLDKNKNKIKHVLLYLKFSYYPRNSQTSSKENQR